VVRALTTPLIGQFDPEFTGIMDEVMQFARQVLLTSNARSYPVSALATGGLEAIINTLVEPGDRVSVRGSRNYTAEVEDIARRYGAEIGAEHPKITIVPQVDPETGERWPLRRDERESGFLVVDATQTLGGCELRTDEWGIDVVVAGVDACLGAPSGMTLVTYTDEVEQAMRSCRGPPLTSYLDLLQLQAYWSPERLNHHTAPTSLVYALREALRLVLEEGLEQRWRRHARVAAALRAGLTTLGMEPGGELPLCIVTPPRDAKRLRRQLLDEYDILIGLTASGAWRIAMLGADARPEACLRVLAALEQVLLAHQQPITPGAARAAAMTAFV
jgi:(S)-ureidoglycine---glyoxylate transaminase